jgi:hypothetical protein
MAELLTYDIGAHRMLWTPNGGTEVDLGFTEDGSEISIEKEYEDVEVHELGAPVDSYEKKVKVEATAKLAQATLQNLSRALDALLTTVTGPPAKVSIDVNPKAGTKATFGKLVFRPRELTSADKSRDKTIWRAAVKAGTKLPMKATTKRVADFKVAGLADQDVTTGKWRIFTEGDPTTAVLFEV